MAETKHIETNTLYFINIFEETYSSLNVPSFVTAYLSQMNELARCDKVLPRESSPCPIRIANGIDVITNVNLIGF